MNINDHYVFLQATSFYSALEWWSKKIKKEIVGIKYSLIMLKSSTLVTIFKDSLDMGVHLNPRIIQ